MKPVLSNEGDRARFTLKHGDIEVYHRDDRIEVRCIAESREHIDALCVVPSSSNVVTVSIQSRAEAGLVPYNEIPEIPTKPGGH